MTREHDDIDTLARTLYGEAEAGNELDAEAIACVIVNRVLYGRWGVSIAEVCLQPLQFSCWNHNDPNRSRIMKASGPWFEKCRNIAARAAAHQLVDRTMRSTHYYETGIALPRWAKKKKPVYTVPHKRGTAHVFYNDIDTRPPKNAKQALDQDKPLRSTRTVRAQAGIGTAIGGLTAIDELKEQLAPYAWYIDWLKWVLIALAVIGIAWTLWARYDDRRKGKR